MSKGRGNRRPTVSLPSPQPEKPHAHRQSAFWTRRLAAAALVAATFLAYWPVVYAGFVFDDDTLVTGNPRTSADDGLYRIWFTDENYEYLPLTYSGFWLEYRLWGLHPLGYHLVSAGLHALNALLLWLLLGKLSVPGAWWGALLFAVHPVTASSVAWISEQKNLWALLFALLCLLAYLKFETSGQRRWYAGSVAAFVAALLGKTSVVMLPCLILAYQVRQAGRVQLKDAARTAPFFLASLILGLATVWFQVHRGIAGAHIPIGNYLERLAAAGDVVWFYLGKALVPLHLSMIYPQWNYSQLSSWPLAALVALLALLVYYQHRWNWTQACWLALGAYILILTPVLGFVPMAFMRLALVADHFQYPALPAVTALLGALAAWAIRRQRAAALAPGFVAAALAFLTAQQAAAYRDDETLWRATIRQNPQAWAAHSNLGKALADRGNLDEALDCFNAGIRLNPDDLNLRLLSAAALLAQGDLDAAAAQYREAIRANANDIRAYANLAETLLRQKKADEAMAYAQAAVALRPDTAWPHYIFAWSLNETGNAAAAAGQAEAALKIEPDLREAHYQLAVARLALGNRAGADAEFQNTLRLDRRHVLTLKYVNDLNVLAMERNRQGRYAEAADCATEAITIDPDLPQLHFNLGNAFYYQSKFREAEHEYREAIRLDPSYTEALNNLRAVENRR